LQVPIQLNEHGQSLPLLAALIAMSSAPNFALRTSDKTCRTSQDKVGGTKYTWHMLTGLDRVHPSKQCQLSSS
jgi:hypothetical protein